MNAVEHWKSYQSTLMETALSSQIPCEAQVFEAGMAGLGRDCGILESAHSASEGPVIHREKNAARLYSVPYA